MRASKGFVKNYHDHLTKAELCPGQKFEIPNVIMVFFAQLSSTDLSAANTVCNTQAVITSAVYGAQKYKVEQVHGATVASFTGAFEEPNACGFVFAGHGKEDNGQLFGLALDTSWTTWANGEEPFVRPSNLDGHRPFRLAFGTCTPAAVPMSATASTGHAFCHLLESSLDTHGDIGIAPWDSHSWVTWHGPRPPIPYKFPSPSPPIPSVPPGTPGANPMTGLSL